MSIIFFLSFTCSATRVVDQKPNMNGPIWLCTFLKSYHLKQEETRLPFLFKNYKKNYLGVVWIHQQKKWLELDFWSPTDVKKREFICDFITNFAPMLCKSVANHQSKDDAKNIILSFMQEPKCFFLLWQNLKWQNISACKSDFSFFLQFDM